MNKNIKRAVAGTIAGVVVIAGGAWYVAAGKVVSATQTLIDTTNAKPHADGSTIKITYDSLSRTMFPQIGVRFVNPVIEVNSPGVAPAAEPKLDGTVDAPVTTAPQPFHGVWKRTGTLDVVTDYFKHEYKIESDGSGSASLDSGTDKVAINAEPAHVELSLQAKDNAAFKQWQTLHLSDVAAVRQALQQIAGAHAYMGAVKITDAASNAPILTQDEFKFDLANHSDEKMINFDLNLLSKGAQATKEYEGLIKQVMAILHMPDSGMFNGSMPFAASRAGKQDIEITAHADMPLVNGQPVPNGEINLTKFNIKNDFYNLQAPINLVLHEDASKRHAIIKLNWLLDVSPAGAGEMQTVLDTVLPMAPMMGGAAKNMDPAVLKQKITAALPTISTLGPINFVLDVDATVPKPGAPSTGSQAVDSKESLTLHQFTFSHKRWALDAKGDGYVDATTTQGPNVNMTLTCKQCTTLTQDVFETTRAVQEVVGMLQPAAAPFPLTDATLTQLNSALAEIGKPGAATGDLDFVVTTPEAGNILLNDKPFSEVMPKLMSAFMPQQPVATVPAPTQLAPTKAQHTTPSAPAI